MPLFLTQKKDIVRRLKRKSLIAQIVLVMLGVELLFLASFTAFNLPTATAHNLSSYLSKNLYKIYCRLPRKLQTSLQLEMPAQIGLIVPTEQEESKSVRYSTYVPQAPVTIFLGYVLGWPLASLLWLLMFCLDCLVHCLEFIRLPPAVA